MQYDSVHSLSQYWFGFFFPCNPSLPETSHPHKCLLGDGEEESMLDSGWQDAWLWLMRCDVWDPESGSAGLSPSMGIWGSPARCVRAGVELHGAVPKCGGMGFPGLVCRSQGQALWGCAWVQGSSGFIVRCVVHHGVFHDGMQGHGLGMWVPRFWVSWKG